MFFEVFKFELNFHRRENLVYVLLGLFFLITFLATTTPNMSMVGGVDNTNINSLYTVFLPLGSLTTCDSFGAFRFLFALNLPLAEVFPFLQVGRSIYPKHKVSE